MEENIYEFLGLTPKDSEAKVRAELDEQIKKWNNQMTRQPARAKAKLAVLKKFKADLDANPNMLKEHADMLFNRIYGIDFGTTHSGIAGYMHRFRKVAMMNYCMMQGKIPSAVFFESKDSVTAGYSGIAALGLEPEKVCTNIKNEITKKSDFVFQANDSSYTVEQVVFFILRELSEMARGNVAGEIRNVCIAYPAYWGKEEILTLSHACELAGLTVKEKISEPVAVAHHYNLDFKKSQTVMIYDLGGHNFDVTVLKIGNGSVNIVSTGGEFGLGGQKWDCELFKLAVEKYVQQSNCSANDIYGDIDMLAELKERCEDAKKGFLTQEAVTVRFNRKNIKFTFEEFEAATKDLLDRTIKIFNDTMTDAMTKGIKSCDRILMAGGMSHMQHIRERLAKEFPDIAIDCSGPEDAIARGAAIYAESCDRKEVLKPVPVLGKGLVLGLPDDDLSCVFHNVMLKGCPLPSERLIHARTTGSQGEFRFALYEHDCNIIDYDNIGEMRMLLSRSVVFSNPLPENSPVDILIQVDDEARLSNITVIDVLNNESIVVI